MSVTSDDLRAAVGAGVITEAQAATLAQLSDERQGYREARALVDEPFELFKGFNEIFIVVGLSILYSGWTAVVGLSVAEAGNASLFAVLLALLQMAFLLPLTQYFTVKRRMIAPSILLSIFMAVGGFQMGFGLANGTGLSEIRGFAMASGVTAVVMGLYWWKFRIPFSLLLAALGVFGAAIGMVQGPNSSLSSPYDLFLLSTGSTESLITITLGLIAFAVALRFDMSDPHRVTRRSANGFWLNVLAAPAIVNSVALTLYSNGSILSMALLFLFLVLMAAVAIIIDRRSFLISGIGYMIALVFTVLESAFGLVMLLVGLGLVLLGANWSPLRCWLLNKLPHFKGKDRLPPWQKNEVAD
ncbi:hypothetical protein [Neptunicoccus cionae]|uniref:hypothetical protein n=1 Tax=Neptunicoccus cionae TaxID=2035344 RepID=UPI000C77ED69|nr:hypothetical protein [Amylibacter cionae]PLS22788.1 hypothetical protein C0U40_01140 [Amylibacter cionae]